MREIKFRTWSGHIYTYHKPNTLLTLPGDIVQQFTGLTDKNGKEIYEGDIVKVYNSLGIIKFNNGSFYIYVYNDFDEKILEVDSVIGNIYENPELLKG